MKKSSFLLQYYETYFFLNKIKNQNKNKKREKKTINDILKIFFRSVFVLNSKFK